ncbi:MAG TPA: hypothetical protein VIK91_18775 [Nannocystis sp.]
MSKKFAVVACILLACKSPSSGDTDTGVGSETGSSTETTAVASTSTTASEPTTGSPTTGTTTSGGSDSGSSTSTSTGDATDSGEPVTSSTTTTGGGGECVPLQCGDGKIYACGDCMDNDGDGKVDTADPECISPCDDKEDTFATGLPGDNMDPCKQDCFFDGNSGGGKGDCEWNLKCDPMNPGGDKCPYDPNFNNCPQEQSMECIETCQVPSGCDCFGCCTVTVDGMSWDVYIGDQDCSLANIDNCRKCTKNEDCDDECHPEKCEVCFGEEGPPPGCEEPSCEDGEQPCTVDDMGGSDCPDGFFCQTGCCQPILPG